MLKPVVPQQSQALESETEDRQTAESEKKWTKPNSSLVFIKPQTAKNTEDDGVPAPLLRQNMMIAKEEGSLNESPVLESKWWRNSGDFRFTQQVTYDQPVSPTTLGNMAGYTGFQSAQAAPPYTGCFNNSGLYINTQQPFGTNVYCARPEMNNYTSAQSIRDAWNAYFAAYNSRQNGMQVANPMAANGGMGGNNAFQWNSAAMMNPMGMMPQQSQPPQTLGFIVLYPAPPAKNPDGTDAVANPNDPMQPNSPNLQAMFVPFDSPQGMSIQANMQQNMMQNMGMGMNPPMNPMMNPMMGGGMMSPYAMNPMMTGMNPYMSPMMNPMMGGGMMSPYAMNPMMTGMNPYMMNPMMAGMNPYMNPMMMGMMNPYMMGPPQIIIQMPQNQGQRMGFFARRRAARMNSDNTTTTATATIAPGNNAFTGCYDPMSAYRIPAKAAYPYGYFGASTEPFQTGNFADYNNLHYSRVTYPGF